MHYVCYVCENCSTDFAINSLSDSGEPYCPSCGETVFFDSGEVMVDPKIMSVATARKENWI